MKKIRLIVSDTDKLDPPIWGGPKRIWNLYGNLPKERFVINYVGCNFDYEGLRVKRLAPNFREFLVGRPYHYRKFWSPLHKKYFQSLRFDAFVYLMMASVREFSDVLRRLKAEVVIASHPWSAPSMKKKKGQLFIYDAHNCEYSLTKALVKHHPLCWFITSCVKNIESAACRKSDLILVCSEQEKAEFIRLYGVKEEKIHIVPNGAQEKAGCSPEEKRQAKERLGLSERKAVIFVGSYYEPNIQAVNFIINGLAPQLKEYDFLIAGASLEVVFSGAKMPENVKFFGTLSEEKLELLMKAADIALNPVLTGSGINIKMLDYMSYGLPVVATECGMRGIDSGSRSPVLVCGLNGFAENISKIGNDADLYLRMSADGRSLARQDYAWKTISKKVQDLILERLPA